MSSALAARCTPQATATASSARSASRYDQWAHAAVGVQRSGSVGIALIRHPAHGPPPPAWPLRHALGAYPSSLSVNAPPAVGVICYPSVRAGRSRLWPKAGWLGIQGPRIAVCNQPLRSPSARLIQGLRPRGAPVRQGRQQLQGRATAGDRCPAARFQREGVGCGSDGGAQGPGARG